MQSFDWRGPRHLRRLRPDLAYAWLTDAQHARLAGRPAPACPDTVVEEGGGTWSPHHRELTPACWNAPRRAGLRVVPWTVNKPADIARLARWGVDGIITDDPLLARAVLGG